MTDVLRTCLSVFFSSEYESAGGYCLSQVKIVIQMA